MAYRKFFCPCCGYKTLGKKPPGTYEICDICFWEDDDVQFDDPDYQGGANIKSLREAQIDFMNGIDVNRKPTEKDERDPLWKPLGE